jgi:hypothetical protein
LQLLGKAGSEFLEHDIFQPQAPECGIGALETQLLPNIHDLHAEEADEPPREYSIRTGANIIRAIHGPPGSKKQ